MAVYYNEKDPKAAAWLRELISRGHLPDGVVDETDIQDVIPNDLREFLQCHFFAGIGGWPLALKLAGWPDDRPVWSGSCPCQPFSSAGKGEGFDDERHLWPAWFHLIDQLQPSEIVGEQVASKDGLAWFDLVRSDLEGTGYACASTDICAAGVGAPHIRQRQWIAAIRVAYSEHYEQRPRGRYSSQGITRDEPRPEPGGRRSSGWVADRFGLGPQRHGRDGDERGQPRWFDTEQA